MVDDKDIFRTAKLMIGRYGDHAANWAAVRADMLTMAWDYEGAKTMTRIMKAIEELQRTEPGAETVQ